MLVHWLIYELLLPYSFYTALPLGLELVYCIASLGIQQGQVMVCGEREAEERERLRRERGCQRGERLEVRAAVSE